MSLSYCRYLEAHVVKTKCQNLENLEYETFLKERNEKIKNKVEQLKQKQNIEKNSLKQKLDTEYETLKKLKDEETTKLIQKYRIRKRDMELQQKKEKNNHDFSNLANASKFIIKFRKCFYQIL